MVLALLGKELDGADITLAGLDRLADGEIVERAIERGRLAPEFLRRMRVRIGDEPIAVEHRQPPIHWRVGGEPRFDGEDMIGEIAIAFLDGIEAGLRAERGEPRRPDMRRDEIGVRTGRERDLQQIARVEPENRPPVGGDIADAGKPIGNAVGDSEIGRIDQVVDFARLIGLLVDRGDFDREHEAHRRLAARRQRSRDRLLDLATQAEQSRLRRNELVFQFGAPSRMGEIAGADHTDALAGGPCEQMLEVEIAAGGARIFRVDVQVGVKAHCGHARATARLRRSPYASRRFGRKMAVEIRPDDNHLTERAYLRLSRRPAYAHCSMPAFAGMSGGELAVEKMLTRALSRGKKACAIKIKETRNVRH